MQESGFVNLHATKCCAEAFPIMKINKSKLRTRETDRHLDAVMRIAISSCN